jgi:hypothetical protein
MKAVATEKRKTIEEYEALAHQLAEDRDAKSEVAAHLAQINQTLQREVLHNQRLILAKLGIEPIGPLEVEHQPNLEELTKKQHAAVRQFLALLRNELRQEDAARLRRQANSPRRLRRVRKPKKPKAKKRGRRR